MRFTAVPLLALATLFATACDGDSSGSQRLTPGDVAGVYRICTLRFVPVNSIFPAANLLERIVDNTPPAGKPDPTLTLSPSSSAFQLIYTSQADAFTQDLRGEVSYGRSEVFPRFYADNDSRGAIATELLLPPRVALSFSDSPRRLATGGSDGTYSVSRRAYATAAGVNESGLDDTIQGRIEISLREGSCS